MDTSNLTSTGNTAHDPDLPVYRATALTLKTGMYISFGAMTLGLAWWLVQGGTAEAGGTPAVVTPDRIVEQLAALNPLALINLGVFLLLATPGITLLVAIVSYARTGNRTYTAIAAVIAAVLILSLAISMKWIKPF